MGFTIIGAGASGAHAARQLGPDQAIELIDSDADRAHTMLRSLSSEGLQITDASAAAGSGGVGTGDVVILASPARTHRAAAERALARGASVVSISDDSAEVADLLALDRRARSLGCSVVVGAGFAPGLTCLLARFAGDQLDVVDEIAVAKAGTGGPACARQHHRALKNPGQDWIDGSWTLRRGGSGRDLVWFPGTIGARDSYRGDFPSPILLQRTYPMAQRISARVTATRRDRMTSRLPMLRPPHDDGGPGGVRVEVRGRRAGGVETVIYGVMESPSRAAGATAAVAALAIADGRIGPGAAGLSELDGGVSLLRDLHRRGIRASRFEGLVAGSGSQ